MQFGAMNFPIKPVLEEISAVAELGMDFIELAMDPPEAHFSRLMSQRAEIGRALRDHRLELVCHLPTFVSIADLTESLREASIREMLHSLETATALGAQKAVLHPGYIRGLAVHVPKMAYALAMEGLARIVARGRSLGLPICIENMFPGVGPFVEPQDFDPIFTALPELKLVLDAAHAHIDDKSGRRAEGFVERFADRIFHLHLSDNGGRHDDHLPLGRGNLPLGNIVEALARTGYNGTITLEIFGPERQKLIKSKEKFAKLWAKFHPAC
jgi:sugar phosphate isomerase/epimerase